MKHWERNKQVLTFKYRVWALKMRGVAFKIQKSRHSLKTVSHTYQKQVSKSKFELFLV